MDVELPNGEVIEGVPDGMSKADLVAKLRRNGHDLSWLEGPSQTPAPAAEAPVDDTFVGTGSLNENSVPGDVALLGKRSVAKLGKGLTELPSAAAYGVGYVAGSANPGTPESGAFGSAIANARPNPDDPFSAIGGKTREQILEDQAAWDAANTEGAAVDRMRNPAAEAAGSATRRFAEPVTESRPVTATREWFAGKEQEALDALSPKVRRAIELSLVEHDEEDGLSWGEGASDPWWWTANIIDLGAQMAPGMGATALSARMTYAAKYRQVLAEMGTKKVPQSLAIKEAEKQALKAATRSAVLTGGLTEGAVAGGQNASQMREVIESLNEETLMAYPGYMELRDEGMTHEQAREEIAKDKAAAIAISTGTLVGLTGAPMNAYFGKLAAKFGRVAEAPTKLQRAAIVGKGALGEGAQEFVQEGGEQLLTNITEQPVDGVDTWDGVLENAITGFVLGGVVGGGADLAVSGKKGKAPAEPAPGEAPAPKSPVATAEAAYEAATAALDQAEASARDPNVKIKYAEVQKLRDAKKKAMVDFTRELLHSGQIKEADQAKVSEALKQAEAEGISATSRKTAGGNISPARDAALEAAANAEQLDEADANDLISNGLAKVNPRGVVVLTPAGRRERKAAKDRVIAEEKAAEKQAVTPKESSQVKPVKKVITRPKMVLPAEKRELKAAKDRKEFLAKQRPKTAERTAQQVRNADVLKATVQAKADDQATVNKELGSQGFETVNPQMRDAFERARRGLPPKKSRKTAAFRLKGAPETATIPGKGVVKVEPVKQASEAAANYRKAKGISTPHPTEYVKVDPVRAKRIAKAFTEMKHEPNNPEVKRAYRSMIDETKAQWDEIKKTGLKVEFIKPGMKDPYAASPREAIEDVRNNNHLWVFPTDSGFGSGDQYSKDNPMLEDTGETVDGHKMKANDVFRIVHDYFGHVQEANGFRADGEENAWQIHASMYSPLARRAMTTETRGQNSWVNYGPKGEQNRTASGADTVYADQKIGLLPAEFSAVPGETLKFKHFSNAADLAELDPDKMGTGVKGAEAKRGGPKVISLYAQDGEVEPDVANGRKRYDVEVPKADLYDASEDTQGLLAQAQVPYGLKQDDAGNMVPVGHRFDMNKFEELVRDNGYMGYHTPGASGILKGQARLFVRWPVKQDKKVEIAARMKRKSSEEKVRGLLTPEENARLKKASAKKLIEVFDELPDGAELAASAVAGQAKRGWYRRSSEALVNVFGPDAPRFAALLAALSPQTSVEWNFRNAVAVWVGWEKAGRPTDRKKIEFVMRNNMFPSTSRVGKANVLPAWINNTVKALSTDDPTNITLSGPKVDSFAANLRGETERVTLDAWMANWAGVNQTLFKGGMTKDETNPGMRPGYLAYAARVREAAQILTDRTGETWTAAEVQETVWSWAKTLYEEAESYGALATAREILDNKELTDDLINATPDFAGLFEDPQIAASLRGTVYGPRAARSAGEAAAAGRAGRKATPAAEGDAQRLRKAADRLDALRKARKAAEAETREESAMSVSPRLYHVTPVRNLKKIQAEGLLPKIGVRSAKLGESAAGVFTFHSIDEVEDALVGWLGEELGDSPAALLELKATGNKAGFETIVGSKIAPENIKVLSRDVLGETSLQRFKVDGGLRVSNTPTKGIASADLQEVAARVTRELGVTAKIADTAADLPVYIRDLIPEGAEDNVTGMFVEDQITGETEIWYVRENLDSKNEAYENALHEAVGHMGLRAVLGKSYHKVMEDIRTSFPGKVQWAARQNQIDMNHPDPATRRRLQSLAAEELVAYAAGQVLAKRGALSEQSVWRKIVAKVRDILRNVGLLNSYSGEDIEALIYRARDYFRKPARARAEEISYAGDIAMKVKTQPEGAPQWLTPEEYLAGDPIDDLNPAPEREGLAPKAGPVNEQIVFPPGFDNIMSGNDPFFGQTTVEIYADGRNIGHVALSDDRVDGDGWSAEYVYIDPEYRGKGVAQRAYKAISDKLGVKPRPALAQTGLGARMWDSFSRRHVAFRMKNRPQTKTEAFKEWFKDSKVRDTDGEPLVVYHGTRAYKDFSVFNTGVMGRAGAELGSHFGNIEAANHRSAIDGGDENVPQRVLPVYLSIQNPLRLEDRGTWGYETLAPQLRLAGIDLSGVNLRVGINTKTEQMRRAIEAAGYDGVVYRNTFEGSRRRTPAELEAANGDLVIRAEPHRPGYEQQFEALYDGDVVATGRTAEEARASAMMTLGENYYNLDDSYIAFHPEQIKSATGNIGTFNPTLPNIAFAYKQGPTGNADLDSFISKIGVKPQSLRERWNEFKHGLAERAAMAVFDELHGIKAAEQIAGVDEKDSGYVSARLSRAAPEVTASIIENGPPVWNDGAPDVGQGMGLLSILKPLKGNVNLWLAYIAGRRASMLKGQGRENLFTAAEITAATALAQQHPEFDVARQQYNQLQKQVLDFAEEAGVIDPQTRAMWEHADYIPFYRVMQGGEVTVPSKGSKGIGFVRNQIKQLKGGRDNIGDPLENIVRNWQALMDASLQAYAGRMTIDNLNGSGLVTPAKFVANAQPIQNLNALLAANPNLANALTAAGINIATMPPAAMAGLQKMLNIAPPAGEDVVTVWRNGRKEFWHVHDPNLYQSLKNINPKLWGPWMKLFSFPKRVITKTITLTPQFMVKNFWRDMWHTFVTGAQIDKDRINMLPTESLAGLASALANSPDYRSMVAGGGGFGESFIESGDPASMAGSVRRAISKGKSRSIVLDTPMKVWRAYRHLQNAAENANRVAVYKKARASGQTRRNSLYQARDLMDFSMRGNAEIIRLIVGMTPFFNARIQGLYRLGRGIKQNYVSVALRGLLLSAATLALLARNHDDERYKELTDQQKANYWHFFTEDGHFMLPKPFEVGTIFGTVPEAIGDAMLSDQPDATKQAAKYVGYSFGETLSLAPQPATLWPLVELAINQDTFTGSPILTQGDESVLPEDQRGPGTSPTYAALAGLMPSDGPEALRSPKQLEHLGRGYIGNIQDYVLLASDALVRKAMGEAAPPEKATRDLPGLRDFYRTGPARNTRYQTTMYELANQAAKVQGSIKRNEDADTDEGYARVEKLETENAPLLDVAEDFKGAAKEVTDLKKEQRQIQLDPVMTPADKRTAIDEIQQEINDIAKDVYDLRPGGKLNSETAAELLLAPPTARANILRNNNMPATADLLEQLG